MFNTNYLNKSFSTKEILIVFISLFMLARANIYQLRCEHDYKECGLVSEMGSKLRVQNLKCIDDACKDTFLIADDDKWYVCEHSTKRLGKCSKLFKTNTLQLQSALLDLLIENSGTSDNNNNQLPTQKDDKRYLPFETLNYGKRSTGCDCEQRRALPFETMNYGKRSAETRALPFETMNYGKRSTETRALPFETMNYGKRSAESRALPFETMNYGKRSAKTRTLPFETLLYGRSPLERALPFETMNYGKRAYIPIDGYIMGKREQT